MKINKAILGICILLLFSAVALASVSSENDISLEYKLDSGTRRNTINESNTQLTYNLRSGTQPQVLTEDSIRLDITPTNTPPKIIDTNNFFNFKTLTTEVVWAALSLVFNNSFGTIDFEETIDISRRSTVNLDTFVDISSNYISINGTALSEFNKTTIISIRDLSFSNVRVMKNGEDCLGCTLLSYSGGNMQFQIDDLPGFAIYQASDGSVNPAIRIATNAIVSSASLNITGATYNGIYPSNVTIDIGNDGTPEFSPAGELNTSTSINDFTNVLNSILPDCTCPSCTLSNSYLTCTISLDITSDTAGVIELSNLNISQNINNVSWDEDNNYTIIDLDDYFYDADMDNLTYSYTETDNISVSITNGIVSLAPALNFFGTRTIVFNATDGTNTTLSNNVTLTINSVNDAPILTTIPNQSWLKNTNNTGAFDLDDYFSDVETASLTYNVYKINNTGNVTISIASNNTVSFYPAVNWAGTEVAYFTASDGILNTSSNNITLSVSVYVPPSAGGGEDAAADGEGAEGGAGPAKKPKEIISNFTITIDLIKISLVQGKTKTTAFKITNTGDTTQRIKIEPHEFPLALFLDETEFSLAPGESKTITLDISAMKELPPEIYTGKIYIKSKSITKVVRLIIEVEPRVALFDIIVRLPRASKRGILKGEEVQADISMFNMGDLKPVDVELEYSIKDIEGNVITGRTETLAVETENGITRGLLVPDNVDFGDYLFYAKITYGKEKAVASELFEIVKERPSLIRYYFPYILGIGITLFILGIVMFILPLRIWKTPKSREGQLKLLFKQKLLLEKEKQKELRLELQKKELVEKLKRERIKEQEKLVREKIRFKNLEFGRKSRENRERKLQMREFLRILGIYKTKADKKEDERKERKNKELEAIEKKNRELTFKKERKTQNIITKRTRTRRLHEFLHTFGLHRTEKERKAQNITTKRTRTRRLHEFLHTFGLYKTKEERRRKEREKEEEEKKGREKRKEKERIIQFRREEEERKRKEKERIMQIRRVEGARKGREERKEEERIIQIRREEEERKRKEEERIIQIRREEEERKRKEKEINIQIRGDEEERKRKEKEIDIQIRREKEARKRSEGRKTKEEKQKENKREASKKTLLEKQRELENRRRLKEQRKQEKKELKKRKAEYEKRRKTELKLKKRLNKNVLKFNILSERTKQLIKDKKLSSVISSYIKLRLTYDKLITIPLKSEEKKNAFIRLNDIYQWLSKEKQAKTREKETKRKNWFEKVKERKVKGIEREKEKNKQEMLRKQVEEEKRLNKQKEAEEGRKEQQERIRLREQRKREEERKRLYEENRKKKEIRRKKRKKELYKTLHNLGLYKTKKEKRERLRELKKKELQRKRIEGINKKRKLAELERKNQKERIENTKKIRELEKKKKKNLRLKKKLAKGKLRFESDLKKAEEYIVEKNFAKVVMSYARLRSIYNKLTVLPIISKDKDELYSRLDKIYLWISQEKQAKQKRKEAEKKKNEGTLAKKRKEGSRLKELKQQQEEQERQKRIRERLEKERIEKEETERRRKLEELKRTEDEKRNLKELHEKYKAEKDIKKKAELLKAKDLTKTKGIKQRILKERKDNLESKKKIVEFNGLIIKTASLLKKRSKKELSILFEDLSHKYHQLLSYNLHPKDKTQIKIRMRWIRDKIGA
ncbi:MAG: Ig-like domain-containing protein [Candidatus Woesearchaeota archaeon]|nr:Ig-like domain-containing protein [Candidatus Woesearchaeota archaeon]